MQAVIFLVSGLMTVNKGEEKRKKKKRNRKIKRRKKKKDEEAERTKGSKTVFLSAPPPLPHLIPAIEDTPPSPNHPSHLPPLSLMSGLSALLLKTKMSVSAVL